VYAQLGKRGGGGGGGGGGDTGLGKGHAECLFRQHRSLCLKLAQPIHKQCLL